MASFRTSPCILAVDDHRNSGEDLSNAAASYVAITFSLVNTVAVASEDAAAAETDHCESQVACWARELVAFASLMCPCQSCSHQHQLRYVGEVDHQQVAHR